MYLFYYYFHSLGSYPFILKHMVVNFMIQEVSLQIIALLIISSQPLLPIVLGMPLQLSHLYHLNVFMDSIHQQSTMYMSDITMEAMANPYHIAKGLNIFDAIRNPNLLFN